MTYIRGEADLEIYTHDISGKLINDKYDILEIVADYLSIEIKGTLKGLLTKDFNKKIKENEILSIAVIANKKEQQEIYLTYQDRLNGLKPFVLNNKTAIETILQEAENYSDLASNGGKRRKRRRNYFKNNILKSHGIEMKLSDYNEILEQETTHIKI